MPASTSETLLTYGQLVWLDYIRRHLLKSGDFARRVENDGVRGVTSNPSIFEKAIAGFSLVLRALSEAL